MGAALETKKKTRTISINNQSSFPCAVQPLTIFFLCLDPSLHTKTTAVLNTKRYATQKNVDVSIKFNFGTPPSCVNEKGVVPKVAIWGSFFHFPKEGGGLIQDTLVWSSRSPIDKSATWQQDQLFTRVARRATWGPRPCGGRRDTTPPPEKRAPSIAGRRNYDHNQINCRRISHKNQ